MKPKQGLVSIERGCNSEGYLEMVNRLLRIALGVIYLAESAVRFADPKLFAFLREKINRAECGLFFDVRHQ